MVVAEYFSFDYLGSNADLNQTQMKIRTLLPICKLGSIHKYPMTTSSILFIFELDLECKIHDSLEKYTKWISGCPPHLEYCESIAYGFHKEVIKGTRKRINESPMKTYSFDSIETYEYIHELGLGSLYQNVRLCEDLGKDGREDILSFLIKMDEDFIDRYTHEVIMDGALNSNSNQIRVLDILEPFHPKFLSENSIKKAVRLCGFNGKYPTCNPTMVLNLLRAFKGGYGEILLEAIGCSSDFIIIDHLVKLGANINHKVIVNAIVRRSDLDLLERSLTFGLDLMLNLEELHLTLSYILKNNRDFNCKFLIRLLDEGIIIKAAISGDMAHIDSIFSELYSCDNVEGVKAFLDRGMQIQISHFKEGSFLSENMKGLLDQKGIIILNKS